jgi:glycosyltransferase involved in cell wall biosynthesis
MMHVGHVLDAAAGWEQRVAIAQLADRLPSDRFQVSVAAIDPLPADWKRSLGLPVRLVPRRARFSALAAPALSRFLDAKRVDVVHAWGSHAAAAARAATARPLVIELFDPVSAATGVKVLRSLARPRGFGIVCASEIVRRRLIEGGAPPESTVLIRPAVDFAQITRWRRGGVRDELGLSRSDRAIVVPEPIPHADGHIDTFLAAAMLNTLSGDLRMIVPGVGREQDRLAELDRSLPIPQTLVRPGDRVPTEQLVAVSDVLVVAARGDVPTTEITWAMAAGVAVIGSAVYAVSEMLASRVNGLLFKQLPGKSMVTAIARLLQDVDAQAMAREVARGQAYEVFGLRRFVEQHVRLYENVRAGRLPADGIADPARSA